MNYVPPAPPNPPYEQYQIEMKEDFHFWQYRKTMLEGVVWRLEDVVQHLEGKSRSDLEREIMYLKIFLGLKDPLSILD